jgi:tetratricopeptide (TPR) repeat protein
VKVCAARTFAGWFLATLLCLARPAPCASLEELIRDGDLHDQRLETKAALADYLEANRLATNNAEVLWRIAKQYLDSADDAKTEEEKKTVTVTALDYARQSVAADAQNSRARLSLAICYGRASNYSDNRTKVRYSRLVRDEALASIRLNSKDDVAYFVLGRWNYEVANFNSILRALVRVVYGELPDASNDEAIRNYQKAIALAPGKVMHHYHLGRAYQAGKQKALAAEEYRKAIALPVLLHDDPELKRKSKQHLKEVAPDDPAAK